METYLTVSDKNAVSLLTGLEKYMTVSDQSIIPSLTGAGKYMTAEDKSIVSLLSRAAKGKQRGQSSMNDTETAELAAASMNYRLTIHPRYGRNLTPGQRRKHSRRYARLVMRGLRHQERFFYFPRQRQENVIVGKPAEQFVYSLGKESASIL